MSDYGTGSAGGPRAKTSQKSRERPSKIKSKGQGEGPGGAFDTAPDESAFRSSAYKSGGSKWNKPMATEAAAGPKPYELWKQNMVIQPETVVLGQNRNIKLAYDQSSKNHLTTAKGAPNLNDYKSIGRVYHGHAQ